MIVADIPEIKSLHWSMMIIDEAHRLKNTKSKLADLLRQMHIDHKVMLTGTPLQNNMEELYALLNFLNPEEFYDVNYFMQEYGHMSNQDAVEKMQNILKPIMLRRLKEDVEKSLAPKEETIIEVELTNIQKKYYRAILERNFDFLSKGASSGNVPSLMNTMMELRKCCNHPFLIKGKFYKEY
jgi:SNF2 family DNA or RNA helicase